MKISLILIFMLFVLNIQQEIEYGTASYYANKFEGRKTASGAIFYQDSLTAAHKTLRLGTLVQVKNLKNDSVVTVVVNDRMSKKSPHCIDLSAAAAKQLNFYGRGTARVAVSKVN